MLSSKIRLTTELFNKAIAGRSFHSLLVSTKVVVSPEKLKKKTRFAVAASKKNFKTAVDRNTARRKIYAAIDPILPNILDGFLVIIHVKPETMKLAMPDLCSAIESIFNKAGIMKL